LYQLYLHYLHFVYKMADNVKVAVRVRPFNDREKKLNATLCIEMDGKTTYIKNPADANSEPRKFTFDYSYWSHDEFKERDDGYNEPLGEKYADQTRVFADLGQGVLDNAWQGYNCSLFAYGQTGSGKSYSMVGYGANKGIVPIVVDELFKAVAIKKVDAEEGEEYQVMFSMLEIYNEQVRNLLDPASFKVKGGLKVRQHPKLGFFVDGVKLTPVSSYEAIENLMEKGNKNRTVASTNMNATSSRAHTIFSVNFVQKVNVKGQSMTKTSVINLVDLAGSERAESTGATGDRLKEGAAINLSLTMLGNVIKALADPKKGVLIPFRDSKLTMLLQNALSGNSKTVMIAALSPAGVNYDETVGTLRFADRAKAIKTKAVVNESPTEKLIRELREENAKLMEELKKGGVIGGGNDGVDAEAMKELQDELKRNQEEMESMQDEWQQKLKDKEKELEGLIAEERLKAEQQRVLPHLWNLHEDQALTAKILHFLKPGSARLGTKNQDNPPEIIMNGLGMQAEHALIVNTEGEVTITPVGTAKIFLNGNEILEKKVLHHHDRMLFGSNNLFIFHHPEDYSVQQQKGEVEATPTYEDAQEELAETSGLAAFLGEGQDKEDMILQGDIIQIWPMVGEANAMSEEMNKKVKFEIVLISPRARGKKDGRTEVCVKMKDLPTGNEFVWDRNQFINRKYLMQELYQNFVEEGSTDVPKEEDAFWEDPDSEVLIGSVHVYIASLAYAVELEEKLQITDFRGQDSGMLEIAIFPCQKDGKDLDPDSDDAFIENPQEMIGRDLHFKVKVINSRGLPSRISSSFGQFSVYLDDRPTRTTEAKGINPNYNHEAKFSFSPVTQQFLTYLQSESLVVEVWGRQKQPSSAQTSTLNTKELMTREKSTLLGPNRSNEAQFKVMCESSSYKKRAERAEEKLRKICELIENTSTAGEGTIKVLDIEMVLKGGHRMKAVAKVIEMMEKAKTENMGRITSSACSLQ